MEYKKNFFREVKKGEEFDKQIEVLKSLIKAKLDDSNNIEIKNLVCQKKDLIQNLTTMSKEVKYLYYK